MKSLFRRLCAMLCVTAMLITSAAALSVEDARKLLEERFVDPLPAAAYEATTLDELFYALGDPYTYYMTAEEYEAFLSDVESDTSVVGIGAAIFFTLDGIAISSVLPGGGAEEAGLQSGDTIIAINGESCVPANESHRQLIVGEAGTYVTITVLHPDGTTADYRICRRLVEIHNTNVKLENGVGWIDCDSFGSETGNYFASGIHAYDDKAHIWVVDLRGNSGGVTTSAIASLGAFTGGGALLYFRDRNGKFFANYHFEDYLTPDPCIVLINGSSASACEVFSAGIRDRRAGISIGQRTYGKGLAQTILDSDGYSDYFTDDAMKVTVYRFFSPEGNTNDRIGVIPTLLISNEHTESVAKLLSTKEPDRPAGHLRLTLAGWNFYIDLTQAESEEYAEAFCELISALPPDAQIELGGGNNWGQVTTAMITTLYGDESRSRMFTDVSESEYADAINALAVYDILRGTGNGAFDPKGTLTRAQLCSLLAQAMDISASTENHFTDVPSNRWFADSVNAMAEMGLVNGKGGGKFDPNGLVTQQEYITIMGRLASFLNFYANNYEADLSEEQLSDETYAAFAPWARASAATLTGLLVTAEDEPLSMLHKPLEQIDPTAPVLREEAAAVLYNVLTNLQIILYK